MAIIKTFTGTGPNPNVPFAGDMPRPQFIGQAENSLARLANNVTKMSIDYMDIQKKQKDAASIAQADKEKILFQSTLDGDVSLYDESGNINIEEYQGRVNNFYDQLQPNMSSESYSKWKNTQTVLDARKIGSLSSENMKRTREANRSNYLSSLEVTASNSMVGSFEDMQDARFMIQGSIEEGIESRLLSPKEATMLENDLLQKTARSYISNLQESVSGYGVPVDQVHKMYDNAMAFVNADPYGIYSQNEGLRNLTRSKIATDRLNQVRKKQEEGFRLEAQQDKASKIARDNRFSAYKNRASQLYAVQNDPTEIAKLNSDVLNDLRTGVIDQRQADYVLNYNIDMQESLNDSKVNTVAVLQNEEAALKYISTITNPAKRKKALAVSRIPGDKKTILERMLKYSSENPKDLIEEYIEIVDVYDDIVQENPSKEYTNKDLEYTITRKRGFGNSDEKIQFAINYQNYLKTKYPRSGIDPAQRVLELDTLLNNSLRKKRQQEQAR